MISANDLRRVTLSSADNGYSVDEVNALIDEAATTIDAYANENKELYHKMEVLASKIEEYREEENSIKTALITAQKMADKVKKEAADEAQALVDGSKQTAETTIGEANESAEKIVNEARNYASNLLKEKTAQANNIVVDAEKKANDAISSSKIVAQNILDQAREISDDLIAKSKEEKEAYEILVTSLKADAASFIENLKSLYTEQLSKLNAAKLDADDSAAEDEVASIHSEIDSLVSEIEEIQEAIPDEISIDKTAYAAAEEEEEAEETPAEDTEEEIFEEEIPEEEITKEEDIAEDEEKEIFDEDEDEDDIALELVEEDDEPADPMAAVEAFSQNEITPIDTSRRIVPEIDEEPQMEKSLFDTEDKLPFENYFNVNTKDAHFDKTQQISLVPPEDDDDDEPKFKGFFKKRK